MSDKFSPTLRLGDLNDFIAPSQACVVSLKGSKKPLDKKPDRPQVLQFQCFLSFIGFISAKSVFLCAVILLLKVVLTPKQQLEPVKISLKDCLACRYVISLCS